MTRLVDLNELDALAGEWRSAHNLLMEAAVKAREDYELFTFSRSEKMLRYAAACEAVATRLSNPVEARPDACPECGMVHAPGLGRTCDEWREIRSSIRP